MSTTKKTGYQLTVNTLTDITVSMIEHEELSDSICALNFIDHYRAYIQNHALDNGKNFALANFETFITSQKLLNLAACYTAMESGERLNPAPLALKVHTQQSQKGDVVRVS